MTPGSPGSFDGSRAAHNDVVTGTRNLSHAEDLYRFLGVARTATAEEITAAFRARAKDLHPDRAPEDPAASEEFKAISRAYTTLSRPRSRAAYDARHPSAGTDAAPPSRTPEPPGPVWPAPRDVRRGPAPPVTLLATSQPIFPTTRRARLAIAIGIACVVVGLALVPVVVGLPGGPDTVGRDVTMWLVIGKLVICGVALVGVGWWRLRSLREP